MSETTHERRRLDPLWFRVLERFGLPTLYAIGAGALVVWMVRGDVAERRELLHAIRNAVEQQTVALRDLKTAEDRHADAVAATWPRLRIPARLATTTPPTGDTP
jgi:hypothetical protein